MKMENEKRKKTHWKRNVTKWMQMWIIAWDGAEGHLIAFHKVCILLRAYLCALILFLYSFSYPISVVYNSISMNGILFRLCDYIYINIFFCRWWCRKVMVSFIRLRYESCSQQTNKFKKTKKIKFFFSFSSFQFSFVFEFSQWNVWNVLVQFLCVSLAMRHINACFDSMDFKINEMLFSGKASGSSTWTKLHLRKNKRMWGKTTRKSF